MALLADDFQSYSVGANPPYGSLTTVPGNVFTPSIVTTPAGIKGKSKCVLIPGSSGIEYIAAGFTASFTVFAGYQFTTRWGMTLATFLSGTTILCTIEQNTDSSISVKGGDGTYIFTALDSSFYWNKWYWLQFNITVADVGGFFKITAEVGAGDQSIGSGAVVTGLSTSGVTVGVKTYRFKGDGYYFSELTIDNVLRAIGTDPNPGAGRKVRQTQAIIEMHQVPDSAAVRVTQGIVEVLELPDSAKIRITQGIIELWVGPSGWHVHEE